MYGKTGHRTVTPNSLRGEHLAQTYIGLPDGVTYHQALKLIRRYVNGTPDLSRRAKLLMLALLQIQAKAILMADSGMGSDMTAFTVFAKNETLEHMLCMARRTVQKALAELRDRVLVWCNDAPDRNRSRSNGINLLPAFARTSELAIAEAERAGRRSALTMIRRQYSTLKIALEGLRLSAHGALGSEVEALIRTCDVGRRREDSQSGIEPLIETTKAVDDLKRRIAIGIDVGKDESPQGDSHDAQMTYNPKIISIDVVDEQTTSETVCEPDTAEIAGRAGVLGPDPETLIRNVENAFEAKGLPLLETKKLPPGSRLRLYGNAAAADIRLKAAIVHQLQHRFGEIGASYLLIQAACDPAVRNRAGWARSFLREDFADRVVDTRGAFFRWRVSSEGVTA
ncbi:helix-turn-helix domain-containing protein [Asticcacaulis sp. BYS171W]|uniref:Helix-turn-helix domain-containing protein n=1 Tax=Asticcacaulis aquaticus TaxID=2984212 RepID=A0ABT5HWP2_9CAUL|nr:helix-turn-helix domain-containing protein [Asticcacaulis aquaticus]MDC7684399.1 helix-turn-helix domain-containing protein [Asticcacaulis aquaticus]